MDHSPNKLDECIFDYLVSHANEIISIDKIFYDITTNNSGHRCSRLNSIPDAKKRVTIECYTLDRHYKKIKKIFNGMKLYLIFDKDNTYEFVNYDQLLFEEENNYNWDIDANSIIDDIFKYINYNEYSPLYFTNNFNGSDSILHILVKNNKVNILENLFKQYRYNSIDVDCKNSNYKTPFELAVELRNVKIASLLTTYKYDIIINKLQTELSNEKKLCSEYQKTIDMTGKHLHLMNKIEPNDKLTKKVIYLDTPLSTFNTYSLYLGYFVELMMLMYIVFRFL